MKKPTISETPYGARLEITKRGVEAATFLAKNYGAILGLDGAEYLQSAVKPTVSTPLVDIYNKVAELGKLRFFTMFDLHGLTDVPTLLTLDDIAVDGKYISKTMPRAFQNVWVNLTPILSRRDAYNRTLQISDVVRFASQVARGILCMSYNDSDVWLSPTLNMTIIEAYSWMFGMHLKNLYNLDMDETNLVRTLFAGYMAQLLDSEENSQREVPPLLYRCKFLFQDTGTPRTLDERFEKVAEARRAIDPQDLSLSIDRVCQILAAVGPQRMNKLSAMTLYKFMSRSPMDSQNMMFAMDYPPYFVYLLLNNLRGGKNPMIQNLVKFGDMKKKLTNFSEELSQSKLFIDKVSR